MGSLGGAVDVEGDEGSYTGEAVDVGGGEGSLNGETCGVCCRVGGLG